MTCRVNRRAASIVVRWQEEGAVCRDGECQVATVRAYRELRERGLSDRAAFDASVTLFRLRHKAASPRDAILQVAEWISDDLERESDGPPLQ